MLTYGKALPNFLGIKVPISFPPIDSASSEGLLAIGGELDFETLKRAYLSGVFPWPISEELPLTWFSPNPRGILKMENFHKSRSFEKFLRNTNLVVRFNTSFEKVIRSCANVKRDHEESTWISEEIIAGYLNLFEKGHAYSVETFEGENLVGGLYGVCFGEVVSGESMFHTQTNASKMALDKLVEKLKKNNINWLDTQMVSPLLESLGGENIERSEFSHKLKKLNSDFPSRSVLFSD